MNVCAAEARHQIANLLYTYVSIADRKDVNAVVDLLGAACVRFPAGGCGNPAEARQFFSQLWQGPEQHRHEVSNLVVLPGEVQGVWVATAHYTRYVLAPEAPFLHTLGRYELVIDGADWSVRNLTVRRDWMAGL